MPGLFDHLPDAEPGRRAPRPSAPTAAPPSVPVDSPLPSAEPAAEKPLSVSQLTARIKALLETRFAQVFVDGEISRPTLHASGHVYFTLKDSQTQINAILWRNSAKAVRFKLTHGLQVQVRGRIEVYPARGQYQLIVDRIEPLGLGPLELAFQQLKEELQRRGWFDPQRKRPLPLYPRRIALVTSEGSAALQDMLRQLLGRWPLAEVWLVPVPVQGEGAARAIAQGIDLVGQVEPTADLLLVGRGGGSLEDLWAFNEEVVAAAILRAPMPVISAVGHETDFTISDHVADERAPTPTAGAARAVPDQHAERKRLSDCLDRLADALRRRCESARSRLEQLEGRPCLKDPRAAWRPWQQQLETLAARLDRAWTNRLQHWQRDLGAAVDRLEALSPLKVLARGYSLTHVVATGAILRQPEQAPEQTLLHTRLAEGVVWSRVVSPQDAAHARPQ